MYVIVHTYYFYANNHEFLWQGVCEVSVVYDW